MQGGGGKGLTTRLVGKEKGTRAVQFVAELLMPEEKVLQLTGQGIKKIERLSGAFKVSPEAMRYRLIDLGYL